MVITASLSHKLLLYDALIDAKQKNGVAVIAWALHKRLVQLQWVCFIDRSSMHVWQPLPIVESDVESLGFAVKMAQCLTFNYIISILIRQRVPR